MPKSKVTRPTPSDIEVKALRRLTRAYWGRRAPYFLSRFLGFQTPAAYRYLNGQRMLPRRSIMRLLVLAPRFRAVRISTLRAKIRSLEREIDLAEAEFDWAVGKLTREIMPKSHIPQRHWMLGGSATDAGLAAMHAARARRAEERVQEVAREVQMLDEVAHLFQGSGRLSPSANLSDSFALDQTEEEDIEAASLESLLAEMSAYIPPEGAAPDQPSPDWHKRGRGRPRKTPRGPVEEQNLLVPSIARLDPRSGYQRVGRG